MKSWSWHFIISYQWTHLGEIKAEDASPYLPLLSRRCTVVKSSSLVSTLVYTHVYCYRSYYPPTSPIYDSWPHSQRVSQCSVVWPLLFRCRDCLTSDPLQTLLFSLSCPTTSWDRMRLKAYFASFPNICFYIIFPKNDLVFSQILFVPLVNNTGFLFFAILFRIRMAFWYWLWSRTPADFFILVPTVGIHSSLDLDGLQTGVLWLKFTRCSLQWLPG